LYFDGQLTMISEGELMIDIKNIDFMHYNIGFVTGFVKQQRRRFFATQERAITGRDAVSGHEIM
jgi:hypothetical protein